MTQLLKTLTAIRFTLVALVTAIAIVAGAALIPSELVRLQPFRAVKRSMLEGLLVGLILVVVALVVDWYILERGRRRRTECPTGLNSFKGALKSIEEFLVYSVQLSWMEADASPAPPSSEPLETQTRHAEPSILSNRTRVLVKTAHPSIGQPQIRLGSRKPAIIVNIADMRRQRG